MKKIIRIAVKFGIFLPYYFFMLYYYAFKKEEKYSFIDKIYKKFIDKCGKRVHYFGLENIPEDSCLFIVANHRSMVDPILIANAFNGRQVSFAMKKELDKGLLRKAAICTGSRFLWRTPKEDLYTIKEMCNESANGRTWLVFPEGTRNTDEYIHSFSAGIFKIPVKSKCTILPVVIKNSESIIEKENKNDVYVEFLEPITYEDYYGMNTIELSKYMLQLLNEKYENS